MVIKKGNLKGKTHNGLLKGLVRVVCNKCQEGMTVTVEYPTIERCQFCNSKDITTIIGNMPPIDEQHFDNLKSIMVKEFNMLGKDNNGIPEGTTRTICMECFEGISYPTGKSRPEKCESCGSKELLDLIGNKKSEKDVTNTLKLNTNGGKLKMASEKVQKALKMLKEEGIDTNVVTDDTKGSVGGQEEPEESNVDEGLIIERSDVGGGMQMYRDYSKDSKFKRLSR